MNDIIETMELPSKEGFTLRLSALVDFTPISDTFEDEQVKEVIERINSGEWLYFCAKVTAYKKGIELSSDYLGGCVYEGLEDFAECSGYVDDMINTVVNEAKETIKELTN